MTEVIHNVIRSLSHFGIISVFAFLVLIGDSMKQGVTGVTYMNRSGGFGQRNYRYPRQVKRGTIEGTDVNYDGKTSNLIKSSKLTVGTKATSRNKYVCRRSSKIERRLDDFRKVTQKSQKQETVIPPSSSCSNTDKICH